MPKLELKSLANKSNTLPVEHVIWSMATQEATAGNDLYATLWATIASTLRAAASAVRIAQLNGTDAALQRWILLYFDFYHYLTTSPNSPLPGSLRKLGLQYNRWEFVVTWPLGQSEEQLKLLADEARKMSRALDTLSVQHRRTELEQKIAESLDSGDAFLHQFIKDEHPAPSQCMHQGRWVTEPNELLHVHSQHWAGQWLAHDRGKIEEVINTIRSALATVQAGLDSRRRKVFTAAQVRTAALKFSSKTSTGIDNWRLRDIAQMPDVVLTTLAELLSDIRHDAIPPLQVLTNIMATLPKKDGSTRTVAIAASLYRLLVELDKEEVKLFEQQNAFENDSATKGASAVHAAEERALAAELSRLEGFFSLMLLWDLQIFF